MDIVRLYQDFSITHKTEGHKHCRPGFVNTVCPFCTGNPGFHLSYNLNDNYFVCWRCGWHPPVGTISKLLKMPIAETYHVIKQYGILSYLTQTKKVDLKKKRFKLPSNTEPLQERHKNYLEKRGFDPTQLEKEWNLLGTSIFSRLDSLSYKSRIIIPFTWNGEVVSFDSRDITNHHPYKYMACPKERELIEHKRILYGNQEKWKETGICVEGPTDVWRLGPTAFATSGIKFTTKQVEIIATSFKRVFIVFDNDRQAQKQAKLLAADLRFRGVDVYIVDDIEEDPGSMTNKEAKYLIKCLIK